jgi:dCTP deaminase
MILADRDIKYYIEKKLLVIEPLGEDTIRENGVDLKIGEEMMRFRRSEEILDTSSSLIENFYIKEKGSEFVINPNEHVLLTTREFIRLPEDLIAFVNLRSTFARLGLFIPPTIVDAGFEGELTIEVIGSTFPVKIHSGDRFLHLVFAKTLNPVEKPYMGKYKGQKGVTLPKVP